MTRRRKKKATSFSDSLFAKWGDKDNFFTLRGPVARAFGGNSKRRRRGQSAAINISGAGSLDRNAPQIAGGGRASRDVPDIGGKRRDRRKRKSPDISGAGQVASRDVPSIGGGGQSARGVPSLGGRDKRKKERVPGISGAGKASRDAPTLGADPYKGKRQPPDISGRTGPWSQRSRERAKTTAGTFMRSITAQAGRFRALSEEEESAIDLFIRRAASAGYEINSHQRLSWKANVMLGKIDAADLWRSDIGEEIQRRYGKHGQDLDLPEAERPKRGFVQEREEVREGGVRPSTREFFSRIIKDVGGRLARRSTLRR